ncbi:MAG: hypothetical protein ACI36W_02950 [Coriobacteriales bacterium]
MSYEHYRSYKSLCDFSVGTLFAHDGYALMLLEACRKAGLEKPFEYVFGSVSCALQGGRAAPIAFDEANVLQIVQRYAQEGVGCRLTFSNYNITEEDLADEQGNFLLQLLNQGDDNGVIVSSGLLAGYIRSTYPKLQLISSLVKPTVENTLGQETPAYYNRLCQDYDIVVLNSAFAWDDAFLEQLEHPEQIELIVNHRCRPNCPLSKEHYTTQTLAAQAASTGNYLAQRRLEGRLTQINRQCLEMRKANPLVNSLISCQRAQELAERGFAHFKIEGRDYPLSVMVRDLGTWIFAPDGVYPSLAQSLLNQPV